MSLIFAALLCACTPSAATDRTLPEPLSEAVRPPDTTFEDVLSEYQDLNTRLSRIVAPLRIANAELCNMTRRDPGFSVHRLTDYPPSLQSIAEELLGVTPEGLHIRAVRPNSSAARARLEAGDKILSVDAQPISMNPSMSRYNQALLDTGFLAQKTNVTVETGTGRTFTATISPQTACDIPARVVFSTDINGHTDGRDVLMTSALMRSVPDDTNLALVVAHEMAHVIAEHRMELQSQALELEADRMALVLMSRAGYDVDGAVAYWADASHPHEGGSAADSTHPTTQARYENFRQELARIKKLKDPSRLKFE